MSDVDCDSDEGVDNDDDPEQSSTLDTSITDSESGLDTEQTNKPLEDTDIKDKDSSLTNNELKNTPSFRPPEVKLSNKSLNTLENLMLD